MNRINRLLMLAILSIAGISNSASAQTTTVSGPKSPTDPFSYIDCVSGSLPPGTSLIVRCQEVVPNNQFTPGYDPAFGPFRPVAGSGVLSSAFVNTTKNGMPISSAQVPVPKGPGKLYAMEFFTITPTIPAGSYYYPGPPTAISKFNTMNPVLAIPVP